MRGRRIFIACIVLTWTIILTKSHLSNTLGLQSKYNPQGIAPNFKNRSYLNRKHNIKTHNQPGYFDFNVFSASY